ncbi:MAG TPA: GspH/FimT family pseudopilin [Casimicrobiaceae bacterium]|jgi:type IV fimbrial biogenesis protein FimT
MNMRTSGFTLIELMIALAIFAFLLFLAGPMYADFMGNSQIRNAAENSLTGVRLAQAAAIKGNSLAKFVIDANGWSVYAWNDEGAAFAVTPTQSYLFAEGASHTTNTPTPAGATMVTFDGLGRVAPNADATASLTQIEFTNPSVTSPRKLRVVISGIGGNTGIKLCDPDLGVAASDPRACPA